MNMAYKLGIIVEIKQRTCPERKVLSLEAEGLNPGRVWMGEGAAMGFH